MTNRLFTYNLIFLSAIVFSACTGTRHLQEGEYLVRKGDLAIRSEAKRKETAEVRIELSKQAAIKENNKILWMRPRLSLHNMIKESEKEQGFKYWMKNKLGSPPEIYNYSSIERVKRSMEAQLFNSGFFNAEVSYELKYRKKQVKPKFYITTGKPHLIDIVTYQAVGTSIDTFFIGEEWKQTLKQDRPYQLKNMIETRQLVANYLMNRGYYYFKPDHLEFLADTNSQPGKVNLTLRLKPDNPREVYEAYRMNEIFIEDNFRLNQNMKSDTLVINDLNYISPVLYIKPKVVANTVHLMPGQIYTRDNHIRTLNHIRSLNVYQFVNIFYERIDSIPGAMNSTLYLSPMKKMSVSGELNANFKSNNYAGPGVLLSFLNRNTFKSAELLNLSFSGRFEAQIGQREATNFAYEFRLDGSLQFPRLYPFRSRQVKRRFLPTTVINLGVGLQERVEYFQMITGNIALRYNWRTSNLLQHRFSPYEFILSNLLRTTEAFEEYLRVNPTVRRSFEEQFILGPSYEIYINSRTNKLSPIFLGLSFDFSGNIITGLKRIGGKPAPTPDSQFTLFSLPYSQYVRSRIDFRYNLRLSKRQNLATRMIIGAGIPYSNSAVMPYIKQYFVGGPNSLRGFAARTIGPGKYQPIPVEGQTILVDQAGDLKLEANLEYRFPIYDALKGAVFADIGNIWLVNQDTARPGGQFQLKTFVDELAVSSGFGLRFDFNPILIRLDFGFPVRYPFPVNGNNWVFREINFFSREWRRQNIILNISLGYPF